MGDAMYFASYYYGGNWIATYTDYTSNVVESFQIPISDLLYATSLGIADSIFEGYELVHASQLPAQPVTASQINLWNTTNTVSISISDWSTIAGPITSSQIYMTTTMNTSPSETWTPLFYLSMDQINEGKGVGPCGSISPASSYEAAGSVVTIKATYPAGCTFGGWVGHGSGAYNGTGTVTGTNPHYSTAHVTMNGPITETATFICNKNCPEVSGG